MEIKKGLIGNISLGVILVLIQIWLLTQADILFPDNTEAFRMILIIYMTITAFVFSWDTVASKETETPLFRVGFLKTFPKFLLFAGITLGILLVVGLFIRGDALPSIWAGLSGVGFGVLLLHAFVIAVDEELIFRSWLTNELRKRNINKKAVMVFVAVVFALFHYAMSGGEWLLLIIYLPLSFAFSLIKDKWSPKTGMANMGVHFAWNVFILGFLTII